MKFELSPRSDGWWEWKATVQGATVAVSPDAYFNEKEARSSIAKARKAFAGAKFAKVVNPEEDSSQE